MFKPVFRVLLAGLILTTQTAQVAHSKAPEDTEPPVISHKPILSTVPGQGVEVRATIKDAGKVAFPRVYYRKLGETKYQIVTMTKLGTQHVAVIPGLMVTKDGLEYYIEAFDAAGNGPTSHGLPNAPHRVAVARPTPTSKPAASRPVLQPSSRPASPPPVVAATPWYKRWWVWTIAGAVVAGSAVAVAVAASGSDEDLVEIQISAPAPQPSLPGL